MKISQNPMNFTKNFELSHFFHLLALESNPKFDNKTINNVKPNLPIFIKIGMHI